MAELNSSETISTVCPYCGVGCGMKLLVEQNRIVKVEGDRDHPANFGKLCTKGATCAVTVPTADRLAYAQVRASRDQVPAPVPLDQAIRITAQRLRRIIDLHGPDAVS